MCGDFQLARTCNHSPQRCTQRQRTCKYESRTKGKEQDEVIPARNGDVISLCVFCLQQWPCPDCSKTFDKRKLLVQHLHKEHRASLNKKNARRRGFKSSSTEDDNENQQGPLGNEFTEVIRLKKEEGKIVYGEQREDGVRKISNPYCLFLVEGFI